MAFQYYYLTVSPLADEVQCLLNQFDTGCLVDADGADIAQQGEIDAAGDVLLVVAHQLQKCGIVIASECRATVVFVDVAYSRAKLVHGEAAEDAAQVEFAHKAVCNGDTMEHWRTGGHAPRLDGVADGVTQVECFADAMFVGVGFHDALLDCHRTPHHVLQPRQFGAADVEGEKFRPSLLVGTENIP